MTSCFDREWSSLIINTEDDSLVFDVNLQGMTERITGLNLQICTFQFCSGAVTPTTMDNLDTASIQLAIVHNDTFC